jgi:phage anti-repressor protein
LQRHLYGDLKWKKNGDFVGFFTKSNSSEQNIYRYHRLKINFQRCCASQNKTRKIKTNSIQ